MKRANELFDLIFNPHLTILSPVLASVVKLVDTPDLGSGALRCVGSSPTARILN